MKTLLCSLLLTAPLLAQTPAASTAAPADPAQPRNEAPSAAAPKRRVTYLGIQTAPASPSLAAQLRLEEGTGVVVVRVEREAPAAGFLQPHDVLVRFDDQLLVNPEQLGVLVRTRRAGDEVTLSYFRAGQPGEVKVKLGEREAAPPRALEAFGQGVVPPRIPLPRHEADRLLSFAEPGASERLDLRAPPAGVMRLARPDHGNFILTDDQGSVEVRYADGQKHVRVRGPDGEVQFDGPVQTPEQREALPEAIRRRLEQVEERDMLQFRTDGRFTAPFPARPIGPESSL